ncbi:hypothetical protein ECC04_015450 [Pseudomonas aeruginosa]|nr:hypothetical protein ECC04_015450 [Pseudomonas aeruginosa]
MSRWAPGKKTPKSVGRAYVGFWFHCSPNPKCLWMRSYNSPSKFSMGLPQTALLLKWLAISGR